MALVRIVLRHDKAANWPSALVLTEGEVGVETDTGRVKVGDGVRGWAQLSYADGPLAGSTDTARAIGSTVVGTSSIAARSDHSHPVPATLNIESAKASGNVEVTGKLSASSVSASSYSGITSGHVSGLQSLLDAKSPVGHSHAVTSLGGFPSTQGNDGRVLSWRDGGLLWVDMATGEGSEVTEGSGISVSRTIDGAYSIALDDSVVNRLRVLPTSNPSVPVELTGNITLSAGANVQIEQSGTGLVISSTFSGSGNVAGVASLNSLAGNVSIAGAVGGNVTVTNSGSTLYVDADVPPPSSDIPQPLKSLASAGTSGSFARADHVHAVPHVNYLAISNDLDYSGYSITYTNDFDDFTAPSPAGTVGMFASIGGAPHYSDGSSWVTLAAASHSHAISDVSGLQEELSNLASNEGIVFSVNGQAPDLSGNVNLTIESADVKWGDIDGSPKNVSYFVNDGDGDSAYATIGSVPGLAPVASVNGATGAVVLSLDDISNVTLSPQVASDSILAYRSGAWQDYQVSLLPVGSPSADGWPVGSIGEAILNAGGVEAETYTGISTELDSSTDSDLPESPGQSPTIVRVPDARIVVGTQDEYVLEFAVVPAPTSYRWELEAFDLNDSDANFVALQDSSKYQGANTGVLSIAGLTRTDAGDRLRCVATLENGDEIVSPQCRIEAQSIRFSGFPTSMTFRERSDGSLAPDGDFSSLPTFASAPGPFRGRWQVSSLRDGETYSDFSRGPLYRSLTSELYAADSQFGTIELPSMVASDVALANYDETLGVRKGYLRFVYTTSTNAFDESEDGYAPASHNIELTVLSAANRWQTNPSDASLAAGGGGALSAQVSATTIGAVPASRVYWEWSFGEAWSPIPGEYVTRSQPNDSTHQADVYPFGKDSQTPRYVDVSNLSVRAVVVSGSSARRTTSASISGGIERADIYRVSGDVQIARGTSTTLTASYDPADASVVWESRSKLSTANYGPWQEVLGASSANGESSVATGAVQASEVQYRVTVTPSPTGVKHVRAMSVFTNVVSGSIPTPQDDDPRSIAAGERSGRYTSSASSSLLNDGVTHYAALLATSATGEVKLFGFSNGDDPRDSTGRAAFTPLKYFPANKYSEYAIDIPFPGEDVEVSVIVSTDPTQFSVQHFSQTASDDTVVYSSPWGGLTPYGDSVYRAGRRHVHAESLSGLSYFAYPLANRTGVFSTRSFTLILDGQGAFAAEDGTRTTMAAWNGEADARIEYPLVGGVPIGFVKAGSATIRSSTAAVDRYLPHVVGGEYEPSGGPYMAASLKKNGNVYVAAVRSGGGQNQVVLSADGGETWCVRPLPLQMGPCSLVAFRGAFYLFFHNGSHYTAIQGVPSGSGTSVNAAWSSTGWNFGTNYTALVAGWYPDLTAPINPTRYENLVTASGVSLPEKHGPMQWSFVRYNDRQTPVRGSTTTYYNSVRRSSTTGGTSATYYDLAVVPTGLSARVVQGQLLVTVPYVDAASGATPISRGRWTVDSGELDANRQSTYHFSVWHDFVNISAESSKMHCRHYSLGQTGGWSSSNVRGATLDNAIYYANGHYASGTCRSTNGRDWYPLGRIALTSSYSESRTEWTDSVPLIIGSKIRYMYVDRDLVLVSGSVGLSPPAAIFATSSTALGGDGIVGFAIGGAGAWTASPASVTLGQQLATLPQTVVPDGHRAALLNSAPIFATGSDVYYASDTAVYIATGGDVSTLEPIAAVETSGNGFIRDGALTKVLFGAGSDLAAASVLDGTGTPGWMNPIPTENGILYTG